MAKIVAQPARASVTVKVKTPPVIVAPAAVFFEATAWTGFSAFEGVGDFYEGGHHEVYHQWTVRGKPLSDYTRPQNFLAEWNDPNIAYGGNVTFRFPDAGTYIIDLWCVDRDGNTAVWSSDPIVVQDADTVFPGEQTICFSDASGETWAGAPAGCQKVTDWADLEGNPTILRTSNGNAPHRLLIKRGLTIAPDQRVNIDNTRDLTMIGTWGTGDRPVIEYKTRHTSIFSSELFNYAGGVANDQILVDGIRFEGAWDSTLERGFISPGIVDFSEVFAKDMFVHIHDCEWDGMNAFALRTRTNSDETYVAMTDCHGTNWTNYAVSGGIGLETHYAFVGCCFPQHINALNGVTTGKGGMGNQHGPIRIFNAVTLYFGCMDVFSRNGWSPLNNVDGYADTADQPCIRCITSGTNIAGAKVNFDRVVAEGGYQRLALETANTLETSKPQNITLDRVILIGTARTAQKAIGIKLGGATIRNVYAYEPDVTQQIINELRYFVDYADEDSAIASNSTTSQAIYNCTVINLQQRGDDFDLYGIDASWDVTPVADNNLIHAPNITNSVTSDAVDLSTAMTGITPRFAGVRTNFVPLEILGGATYLPETDLLNTESFVIPYSALTDLVSGGNPATASATTQAYWQQVDTDSASVSYTPRHTINPGSADQVYSQFGEFTVAYEAGGVRITNTSGVTWPLPSGSTTWLVGLDRAVNIPAMDTSYASPATIPVPNPDFSAPGSASGRVTDRDLLRTPRLGNGIKGALL